MSRDSLAMSYIEMHRILDDRYSVSFILYEIFIEVTSILFNLCHTIMYSYTYIWYAKY